mmetsp:Transcript_100269/g.289510  ORF Transcript_100269/g.289510 Transcript_100269/m.289510 type:complete len:239 (+) Transcript_100269:4315-5031(+)
MGATSSTASPRALRWGRSGGTVSPAPARAAAQMPWTASSGCLRAAAAARRAGAVVSRPRAGGTTPAAGISLGSTRRRVISAISRPSREPAGVAPSSPPRADPSHLLSACMCPSPPPPAFRAGRSAAWKSACLATRLAIAGTTALRTRRSSTSATTLRRSSRWARCRSRSWQPPRRQARRRAERALRRRSRGRRGSAAPAARPLGPWPRRSARARAGARTTSTATTSTRTMRRIPCPRT